MIRRIVRRSPRGALWTLALAAAIAGCGAPPRAVRPSLLLVVIDTLRADAVSTMGEVPGTTPFLDRLAGDGTLFLHAYANAPWTLPSHATLFTGRLPLDHGAGYRSWALAPGLETIAERLRDSGYRTVAVSENPFVGPLTGLDRGFDRFFEIDARRESAADGIERQPDLVRPDAPLFLFVNLIDPHAPYGPGTATDGSKPPPASAGGASLPFAPELIPRPVCGGGSADFAADQARYLDDVRRADAKLARIHAFLSEALGERPLVTVVTSDHGEHFGEHGLAGHLFSVREELLHVPLVVNGAPALERGRREAPVQLGDLRAALLDWTGVERGSALAAGFRSAASTESPAAEILSTWVDLGSLAGASRAPLLAAVSAHADELRRGCSPSDRIFGDQQSLISFPAKLVRFGDGSTALYDLVEDRGEQHDRTRDRPALADELRRRIESRVEAGRAKARETVDG